MNTITIASKAIRVIDGLYCLNDLHKASGSEDRHLPKRFIRLGQTQELIAEIKQRPDMALGQSGNRHFALKSSHGGSNPGTYACKELVYAYAMWISPKFNLHVIRAFDNLSLAVNKQAVISHMRMIVSFDHEGNRQLNEISPDQFVSSWKQVPDHIRESVTITNNELLEIISMCTGKLAMRATAFESQVKQFNSKGVRS